MKGIIFNLLADAVCNAHGEDVWDDLLEASELEGAWTSVGSYPHEHLLRVADRAAERWGWTQDEVIRWFGRAAIEPLARTYPGFFSSHRSTPAFLRTLNDIHHLEVRKIYPDADLPVFAVDPTLDARTLTLRYNSARGLCSFGEGLIHGAGDHFRETLTVVQPQCVHRGDAHCVLAVTVVSTARS